MQPKISITSKNYILEDSKEHYPNIDISKQDSSVSLTESSYYLLEGVLFDLTNNCCYISRYAYIDSYSGLQSIGDILKFRNCLHTKETIDTLTLKIKKLYGNNFTLTQIPVSNIPSQEILIYILNTEADKLGKRDTGIIHCGKKISESWFYPSPLGLLSQRKEVN